MASLVDTKPKSGVLVDVLPKNQVLSDVLPKMVKMGAEINRGFDVIQSAGMYLGLPWLIQSTTGTTIQWSETG